MEQVLLKMARQLDALDEASLVALWDKYSGIAAHFEPSKRWEESVLVLSLIQAKRWKNQLFNQQWSARSRPEDRKGGDPRVAFTLEKPGQAEQTDAKQPKAKILSFKARTNVSEDEHVSAHAEGETTSETPKSE